MRLSHPWLYMCFECIKENKAKNAYSLSQVQEASHLKSLPKKKNVL